ncbi:hypothetical protein [Bradyrhizobium sp. WSM1743]|uniref:hypothetical protein n=1 Tax=Bradyrhizobium sp. WSM1743 TaxID=318996 RepID=UPI0012EBB555|nr:hypothetical protein [Bradyrhizobium sp. WSM1743]
MITRSAARARRAIPSATSAPAFEFEAVGLDAVAETMRFPAFITAAGASATAITLC